MSTQLPDKEALTLITGNRNYSSWSMRAWLFMRANGLTFSEIRIPLFTSDWEEQVARYSPAGRVPVLLHGELTVWDTAAIIGHLTAHFPTPASWPENPAARATARSIASEMHSGFLALRNEMPQNIRQRKILDRSALSESCQRQIDRVEQIWKLSAQPGSGPFLFGEAGIADVMYAPVALRFATYGIALSSDAQTYVETIKSWEPVREWVTDAHAECEHIDFIDNLVTEADSPLTLG